MPLAYFRHFMLAAGLSVLVVLAGTPSFAQAMVGSVPGMPTMDPNDPGPGPTGGGPPPSGDTPPPSATPEPSALFTGMLGFGLFGAYLIVCRSMVSTDKRGRIYSM